MTMLLMGYGWLQLVACLMESSLPIAMPRFCSDPRLDKIVQIVKFQVKFSLDISEHTVGLSPYLRQKPGIFQGCFSLARQPIHPHCCNFSRFLALALIDFSDAATHRRVMLEEINPAAEREEEIKGCAPLQPNVECP